MKNEKHLILTLELNELNHKLGNFKSLLNKKHVVFTLSNSNNSSVIEMGLPAIVDKINYEIETIENKIDNLETQLEALK